MCYNLILFFVCAQLLSCVWLFETLQTVAPRLLCPWDSPGKNTGVGCRVLLQGIFLTQGSNLHLLHWQVDSLPLSTYVIPNIGWYPEIKLWTSAGSSKKQENSRKTSISALSTMPKTFTVWITINCGKFWKRWEYQTTWPASWETCMQVRKKQLELDMGQ